MSFWGGRRRQVVAGQYLGDTTPTARWEPPRGGSMIELYTKRGELVHSARDAVVEMMGANGNAPEVLIWGERAFTLMTPDAYRGRGLLRYREGLAWPLHAGRPLEIPLHSVDGAPAGKITLPASTGDPNPRAETTESGEPDTSKATDSEEPPELSNPAKVIEWAGTDALRWAQVHKHATGYDHQSGVICSLFASAIENAREAGRSAMLARLGEEDPVATELRELKQLFDLQQTRMQAATAMWRAEKPNERDGVLPDLGDLLQWLMDRGTQALLRAREVGEDLATLQGDIGTILEHAPQSWEDDAAAVHIAIQYVRELERRLDELGVTRERFLSERQPDSAERIAKLFHDTYEHLAPDFGYRTREASAKPWDQVPDKNRALMIATVERVLSVLNLAADGGATRKERL